MLKIITNIDELNELNCNLTHIFAKQSNFSFYSFQYIMTTYRQFHNNKNNLLFFVLVMKNKEITGYLPLYIDRKRTLRFIFDDHTDFCGSIGTGFTYNNIKMLAKLIDENKTIDRVSFDNLLCDDPLLDYLKLMWGNRVFISSYNNHSYITYLNSEPVLEQLKSNNKSELKRIRKKNTDFVFNIYDGILDFPESKLKLLRFKMIKNGVRTECFFSDDFVEICRELYAFHELEIFVKENNGVFYSASLVLKNLNSGLRMVWIDLYDDIQYINLCAYIEYIDYLKQFPTVMFSFGRGAYDYKVKNFKPIIRNLYNLRYGKNRFYVFFTFKYAFKLIAKCLIKG